jgi:hypothetical protein
MSLLSKIDIFFGQHIHLNPPEGRDSFTSPFFKGGFEGDFSRPLSNPPNPLYLRGAESVVNIEMDLISNAHMAYRQINIQIYIKNRRIKAVLDSSVHM